MPCEQLDCAVAVIWWAVIENVLDSLELCGSHVGPLRQHRLHIALLGFRRGWRGGSYKGVEL